MLIDVLAVLLSGRAAPSQFISAPQPIGRGFRDRYAVARGRVCALAHSTETVASCGVRVFLPGQRL